MRIVFFLKCFIEYLYDTPHVHQNTYKYFTYTYSRKDLNKTYLYWISIRYMYLWELYFFFKWFIEYLYDTTLIHQNTYKYFTYKYSRKDKGSKNETMLWEFTRDVYYSI